MGFRLLLLFVVTVVALDYRSEDVTKALSRYHRKQIVRNDAAINAIFSGRRDTRQDFPIEHYPDLNPEAIPIPDGMPTIRFGYVVVDVPSIPNYALYKIANSGLSDFEYHVNSRGTTIINGTEHMIKMIVYNGGISCQNFLILYERLIRVDRVHAILNPVNSDCVDIAALAEMYQIPALNGVDYALPYVMATVPPFTTFQWTKSITGSLSSLGLSCVKPLADLGAKTYAIFYDPDAVHDTVLPTDLTAQALGLRKILNDTLLSNPAQDDAVDRGQECSYLWTFIDQLIDVKPNIIIVSFGSDYTDSFINCTHKRLVNNSAIYQPEAIFLLTGTSLVGKDLWQTVGALSNDLWVARADFTDPHLVSVPVFNSTFVRHYPDAPQSQIGFAATAAEGAAVLLEAILNANSLEPAAILAALPNVTFRGILGDIYLEPDGQNYHHSFVCIQRQNDENPIGLAIYPYDTPGVVSGKYPSYVEASEGWIDDLKPHSKLSRPAILGISFGSVAAFLGLVILAIVIVVIAAKQKWHLLLVPKKSARENLDII